MISGILIYNILSGVCAYADTPQEIKRSNETMTNKPETQISIKDLSKKLQSPFIEGLYKHP
jgi:hypothetical protein